MQQRLVFDLDFFAPFSDFLVECFGADLELSSGCLSRTVVFHARLARELIDAPFLSLRAFLFGECLVGFFEFLFLPVRRLRGFDFAAPGGIGLASEMKDGARANAAWW